MRPIRRSEVNDASLKVYNIIRSFETASMVFQTSGGVYQVKSWAYKAYKLPHHIHIERVLDASSRAYVSQGHIENPRNN